MPPVPLTTEEKIDLQQVRRLPVSVHRFAFLVFAVVALISMLAKPHFADADVSGQLDVWGEFGTGPGAISNPRQFGVDPVDGSVYIANSEPGKNANVRIDKYSAAGTLEGSVTVSRTPETAGATLFKGFIGIAVDHKEGLFYLIQSESGLDQTSGHNRPTATKVLAFSTTPVGGHLEAADPASFNLPAPNGTETILAPSELHVDPSNDELVVSAINTSNHVILQRIKMDGELGTRYEETGSSLAATATGEPHFGFDVGANGTTYIVANSNFELATSSIEGFTLPPKFEAASGPLSLTALPGFAGAAAAEGWQTAQFGFLINRGPGISAGEFIGPQVAVAPNAAGEETVYWKAGTNVTAAHEVRIHGYSIEQQATDAVYGGGAVEQECSIEMRTAVMAPGMNGDLVVLETGKETTNSNRPAPEPSVALFGPGGSECPGPAPLIELKKQDGTEVTEVPAGTDVTLDASGSELIGFTPSELVWTITKEGGTPLTIPVNGASVALTKDHVFAEEGKYTVQLTVKTTEPAPAGAGFLGDRFAAEGKTLEVTGAGTPAPTITKVEPTKGPASGGTTVKITGTHLIGATEVKFGTTATTAPSVDTETEVVVTSPSGTAGTKAAVTVTTAGGSVTSTEEFEWEAPIGTPAPTITKVEPTKGPASGGTTVKITGEHLTGATEVKFGTEAATDFVVKSDGEVTAVSPAGAAGTKVDITVVTPGGPSAPVAADGFEYEAEPIVPKHELTIDLAGDGTGSVLCDSGACDREYPEGTEVTLSAVAGTGSTFTGWSGAGCSGTAPCTVVIGSTAVSVTATFGKVPAIENQPTGDPPSQGQSASPGPGPGPGTGGIVSKPKPKTPAEILKEKEKKALQKCKKLHGKAKAQCTKKAKAIGKPKKKAKPTTKSARELMQVLGRGSW